jgi:hypothetical protein
MISKIIDRVATFHLEAMSNLRSKKTGVSGAVIWVSAGEFAGAQSQHGPRIKVVLGDKVTTEGLKDAVSIRVTDPPQVLGTLPGAIRKDAVAFVELNRETLLAYWNNEIDTSEMIDQLRPVR